MSLRERTPPVRPHRTRPVVVQMGQPVGGLHQGRTGSTCRVGQPDTVCRVAEPESLRGQARVARQRPGAPGLRQRRCDHRGVEGLDAQVQRLRAEPDAQVVLKDPLDRVDLAQGARPITTGKHRPGEAQVRLLVPRVERHQLGPSPGPPQQLAVDSLQPVPMLRRPGLVEVVGEGAGAEQPERLLRAAGIDRSGISRSELGSHDLDCHRVDLDPGLGEEPDDMVAQHDATGLPCALAGVVRRLVQLVRRVIRMCLRPEGVHHLLPVQPVPPGQGQQLHEGDCAASAGTRRQAPDARRLPL